MADEPENTAAIPLGFTETWDLYQRAFYDPTALARAIAGLIEDRRCRTVLDAAAGTGMPAIQMRSAGVAVECLDGDAAMLAKFRQNARKEGVDDSCRQVEWSQLHSVDEKYDYVLCRGNSLVYGTSWGGRSECADKEQIATYLDRFASVLEVGGYLHVDAPWTLGLPCKETHFVDDGPPHTDPVDLADLAGEQHQVSVRERVAELEHSRYWEVLVTVSATTGELLFESGFERHSSKLTVFDLLPLLYDAGFEGLEVFQLEGTRPSHGTVLAKKTRE